MNADSRIVVSNERRQIARLHITIPALIYVRDGVPLKPCTVLDVSSAGGQIRLDSSTPVPNQFALLFTRTGSVRRNCRVTWRRDSYLGVEFAGRFNRD